MLNFLERFVSQEAMQWPRINLNYSAKQAVWQNLVMDFSRNLNEIQESEE